MWESIRPSARVTLMATVSSDERTVVRYGTLCLGDLGNGVAGTSDRPRRRFGNGRLS